MTSTVEEGMSSISLSVLEKGLMTTPTAPSPNPLAEVSPSSSTAPKKKYANDTSLHSAAQQGDLLAVKKILDDVIDAQMVGTLMSGADIDAEVAKIRASVVNEVDELGETALFTAAKRGHLEVVKELLKYSNKESITKKSHSGFDAFHIAASEGHHAIVQVLLDHDAGLSKTADLSNTTPLISAATRGHTAVVIELLSKDCSLLEISKSDGKNALHLAARQGHVDVVKALLDKDPLLARRTDKKGQTALHMAAKGVSLKVAELLLEADAAIVMLPDKFGNTALHVATRKKRTEIVHYLLSCGSNVNARNRDHKTALDIAEALPLSEESFDIKEYLNHAGEVRAIESMVKDVIQIMKDLHTQLEQTNKNVNGIAKELRKPNREGKNNATTSVAVFFATIAFAAMFTVPGGDDNDGMAVVASRASFMIFFICNAIALFTSLAVVVVQITLVGSETIAERRVVEIINKLVWLASVCTTVAFMASSYIVVGRRHEWAAVLVTVVGGVIMAGVLGTMSYHVMKSKRVRSMRKKAKHARRGSCSWYHSEFDDSEVDRSYALLSSDNVSSPTQKLIEKKTL